MDINSAGEICPLKFWYNRRNILPELALAARWVMCVPVTSVSSESFFSHGGQIISKLRASLNADTAETMTFLWANGEWSDFAAVHAG